MSLCRHWHVHMPGADLASCMHPRRSALRLPFVVRAESESESVMKQQLPESALSEVVTGQYHSDSGSTSHRASGHHSSPMAWL